MEQKQSELSQYYVFGAGTNDTELATGKMDVFEIEVCASQNEAIEAANFWAQYFRSLGLPLNAPQFGG